MVIHDDAEMPEEVRNESFGNLRKPDIILQNLLHKNSSTDIHTLTMSIHSEKSLKSSNNVEVISVKKKKMMKNISSCSYSENNDEDMQCVTEINAEDLAELKKAYKQCKSVIKKIESKYGHLLNLESEGPSRKRSKTSEDECQEDTECQCILNKKIVFDDEGKEVIMESVPSIHICPQKLLNKNQNVVYSENQNIQVEFHSNDIELSNNLQELRDILQNPNIDTTYRNLVIDKLRLVKQEHSNEIKFNKHSLIEILKSNSEELLDFKGSNLSVLPGYLY